MSKLPEKDSRQEEQVKRIKELIAKSQMMVEHAEHMEELARMALADAQDLVMIIEKGLTELHTIELVLANLGRDKG
ncbi:unnamed protein product [marine sediment metagenome]|uniref:Uncharacterized protein n=1 Tax=marine sediment metagenome TaxID=412755 RepID=X1S486_9ZZZZ